MLRVCEGCSQSSLCMKLVEQLAAAASRAHHYAWPAGRRRDAPLSGCVACAYLSMCCWFACTQAPEGQQRAEGHHGLPGTVAESPHDAKCRPVKEVKGRPVKASQRQAGAKWPLVQEHLPAQLWLTACQATECSWLPGLHGSVTVMPCAMCTAACAK